MSQELLDKLHTEAELNELLGIDPIEEEEGEEGDNNKDNQDDDALPPLPPPLAPDSPPRTPTVPSPTQNTDDEDASDGGGKMTEEDKEEFGKVSNVYDSVLECTEVTFHTNKSFEDFSAEEKLLLRDVVVHATKTNDDTVTPSDIKRATKLGMSEAFIMQMATEAVSLARSPSSLPQKRKSPEYDKSSSGSRWLELVNERAPRPPTNEDMVKACIGDEFACVTNLDQKSMMDKSQWRRCVLRKVKKDLWEVLDESATELLKEVPDIVGEDEGVSKEWGLWYVFPSEDESNAALAAVKKSSDYEANDLRLQVSPNRAMLRWESFEGQRKQAKIMQKRAQGADGQFTVGDVVQIGLHWVDQTKVDGKNLTAVIVEVLEGGNLRCACKNGVLKNTYAPHTVSMLPGPSNNRLLCGLESAFEEWQGLPKVTEREAARVVSAVGGQGFNIVCHCQGTCDTNRCSCKKAGVLCNSKCHAGNVKCLNSSEE